MQQKWIPVLRETAPRAKSARVVVMPACPHQSDCHSSVPETRPFMPRDNDKNNDSRGRRDRPSGGKGRSGAARGPDKKFAKRGFAGKNFGDNSDGDKRPYAGKADGATSYGKKPYAGPGNPYAGKREGPPPRRDGDAPRRDYGDAPRPARFNREDRPRSDRPFSDRPSRSSDGEKRPYTPRGDRPNYNRDDRAP